MTIFRPRRGARTITWAAGLIATCAALAGCAPKVDVSMTSSVRSQYKNVWLTISGIWFNTSATATPDDTTWQQFTLSTPVTVDLASLSGGTLFQIASSLKVPAGTYVQMRLLPLDPSATLAASATAAGAVYNAEADYTDSSGTLQKVQLELLNPEHGIGITTSLTLAADTSAALGDTTSATTTAATETTDPTTGLPIPSTTEATDPVTGLPIPSTNTGSTVDSNGSTTSSTSSTAAPVDVAVNVDGIHDLVQFTYGKQTAVLLNPHVTASDTTQAGGISGTVDPKNVASAVDSDGNLDIEVTAESVSADGSRHIAVKTVQVSADGTFTIYPLATSSSTSTSYDLVVHGPLIATAIVKSVPVPVGATSSSAVSVGTIEPRTTTSFALNLATSTSPLPAGAFLNLYQTIPIAGEIPYLVEQAALDPFARTLFSDLSVSAGTIDYGTYVSGGNVSLTTVTPSQGAAVYGVSAQAPAFSDAALTATVARPSNGTATVLVTPPAMSAASGAPLNSLTLVVSAAVPGQYTQGELIVSRDGAVVQTVAIDSALAQNGGTTVQIPALPGGSGGTSFSSAVYYVSVRTWNSSNPTGSLHRQSYSTPVDLSGGSITGLTVSID